MNTIQVRALFCPHCGAPARIEPGTEIYTCAYCTTSFQIDVAEPPAPPAPPAPPPQLHPMSFEARLAAMDPAEIARRKAHMRRGCAFVLVAIAVLAGAAVVAYRALTWTGSDTLVCDGNEIRTIDGETAKLAKGPVIRASDNCLLFVKDCELEAPLVVLASGNARVSFDHGKVKGAVAFELRDNASVSNQRTKIEGATSQAPRPPKPDGFAWPAGRPIVCGSNDSITLGGVTLNVPDGPAIVAGDNCTVKLEKCRIDAAIAIVAGSNANVTLRDCVVKAKVGAYGAANADVVIEKGSFEASGTTFDLRDNATAETSEAKVSGGDVTEGNASVRRD